MKARLEDLEEFATRPSKIQKERVKPIEKFDEMQKCAYEELELNELWAARRLKDMPMGRGAENASSSLRLSVRLWDVSEKLGCPSSVKPRRWLLERCSRCHDARPV